MLVASLEGVDDAQDLGSVASGASWVREDGADGLLWIDDEYAANSERNALLVNVGGVLVVDPVSNEVSICCFHMLL